MPPIPRVRQLADIRLAMKSVVDELALSVRFSNYAQFKITANRMTDINSRLADLAEDTRVASSGYASNPKHRRALDMASRELDALVAQINDWQMEVNAATDDLREYARLNLVLLKFYNQMKLIVFSTDIPRPKLTEEELHQIELSERSDGTERAYTGQQVLNYIGEKATPEKPRYSNPNISTVSAKEILERLKGEGKLKGLTEPVDEERMKPLNPDEANALKHLTGD